MSSWPLYFSFLISSGSKKKETRYECLSEARTGRYCRLYVFHTVKVKVKCTLVQALRICTGRTAHRGSRGTALPFHDHGTRGLWGVSFTPRALFTPGTDPVPLVQEVGWTPGPVWTDAENLVPTGIRYPHRPAPSQSPYQLSYPAHIFYTHTHTLFFGSAPLYL
jgi:hypothetical protein